MRAIDLVGYIVMFSEQLGKPVTNLRLQKLLYFIQKESVRHFGTPAFEDDICAWTYGPVIPDVYYAYSHYANMPIIDPVIDVIIPKCIQEVIKEVVTRYYDSETWQLVDMTHEKGSPWSKAIREKSRIISLNDIKNLDN